VGRSPSYMPQKCGWRLSLSKKHLSPAPDPRKEKEALVSACQDCVSTCLGLDKQANKERIIFFERGGGVL